MLAQSFKSAANLGITEPQKEALMKTLVLLETGKLAHWNAHEENEKWVGWKDRKFSGHFNMRAWSHPHDCGTACCIGGTAEFIGSLEPYSLDDTANGNDELYGLFYPQGLKRDYGEITPAQAATALRSYLTTGDARWDLAVA